MCVVWGLLIVGGCVMFVVCCVLCVVCCVLGDVRWVVLVCFLFVGCYPVLVGVCFWCVLVAVCWLVCVV